MCSGKRATSKYHCIPNKYGVQVLPFSTSMYACMIYINMEKHRCGPTPRLPVRSSSPKPDLWEVSSCNCPARPSKCTPLHWHQAPMMGAPHFVQVRSSYWRCDDSPHCNATLLLVHTDVHKNRGLKKCRYYLPQTKQAELKVHRFNTQTVNVLESNSCLCSSLDVDDKWMRPLGCVLMS